MKIPQNHRHTISCCTVFCEFNKLYYYYSYFYIFIAWLSETSNTLNKRINSFLFLRINLVLGSSQKVEVKLLEIWIVRWPDDISSPADDTAMKLIEQKLELFDKT